MFMVDFECPVAGRCSPYHSFIICIKFATAGHLFKALFQTGCIKEPWVFYLLRWKPVCPIVPDFGAYSIYNLSPFSFLRNYSPPSCFQSPVLDLCPLLLPLSRL